MGTRCASRDAVDAADRQAFEAIRTTDGAIAVQNLQAQITGLQRRVSLGQALAELQIELIDLLALRGHLLGRIADYEHAAFLAEELVDAWPTNGLAFLARARMRGTFHRFEEALEDLECASQLGVDAAFLVGERVVDLHQLGRSAEALALCQAATKDHSNFTTLGALAVLHAERGEAEVAESLFTASRACYCSVSPFPLAQLDFQRGRMWLWRDDHRLANAWLASAVRLVPAYAPAQRHLAETEAALGDIDAAIARLRPLIATVDDPEYAAQLARLLAETDLEEARRWRERSAARHEELAARHPAAFADHAIDF